MTAPVLVTVVALLATVLVGATPAAAKGRDDVYERAAVAQVNKARAARGLVRVRVVSCADRVAEARVARMPRARTHARLRSGGALRACGRASGVEASAVRKGRPAALVRGWLRSAGTRAALLRPDVRWVGIGARGRARRWHVSLVFVGPAVSVPDGTTSGSGVMDAGESEVLRLTNEERAKAGLPPLRGSACATSFAGDHSKVMASRSSMFHADMGILAQTCAAPSVAENVAWRTGAFDPAAVVAAWMGSAGHRANILSPHLTHLGVGVERNPTTGTWYFTQDFLGLG